MSPFFLVQHGKRTGMTILPEGQRRDAHAALTCLARNKKTGCIKMAWVGVWFGWREDNFSQSSTSLHLTQLLELGADSGVERSAFYAVVRTKIGR